MTSAETNPSQNPQQFEKKSSDPHEDEVEAIGPAEGFEGLVPSALTEGPLRILI